jgi:hypothetical protein
VSSSGSGISMARTSRPQWAALYVGGALIAACSCWAGVTLYFFRRYTLSAWLALTAVLILLVYKVAVIG